MSLIILSIYMYVLKEMIIFTNKGIFVKNKNKRVKFQN